MKVLTSVFWGVGVAILVGSLLGPWAGLPIGIFVFWEKVRRREPSLFGPSTPSQPSKLAEVEVEAESAGMRLKCQQDSLFLIHYPSQISGQGYPEMVCTNCDVGVSQSIKAVLQRGDISTRKPRSMPERYDEYTR